MAKKLAKEMLPEESTADDNAARSPRSPSPPSEVQVHAPPAAAGDEGQKEKAKPKRDYSLEVEQEDRLLEWMAEHDEVWRRAIDYTRSERKSGVPRLLSWVCP